MIETTFPFHLTNRYLQTAFEEDLGLSGDLTSNSSLDPHESMKVCLRTRQEGIIAGLPIAVAAFQYSDPNLKITRGTPDGDHVKPGQTLLSVVGNSRAILRAERVALNFLGHLSGVASLTHRFVEKTEGTNASICCTRKTLPGLRALQKYAVRSGGGQNHRYALNDAILIKDNHIASAGGIANVLEKVKDFAGHMVKIEIEVDTLEQLEQVLDYKVDVVLLDNMQTSELRKAVKMISGRCLAEASGGVNLDTVADIARTGVDLISVGALTHSATVLDLGLDIVG